MKKFVICCLVLCFLCGCTSDARGLSEFGKGESYDSGYRDGYAEGVADILSVLQENSSSLERYMNVEDIEKSIRIYFRSDPSVDVDEVRDAIIYHPDFERYTFDDLLEEVIKESGIE